MHNPARAEYRQGDTLGAEFTHWFRAKFFQQYRLFFRYNLRTRIIIFAWVKDDEPMRAKRTRAVAKATWSRFARLKPPSEVLILLNYRRKKTCFKSRFFKCGRRERIRTSDPLVPNQLRYQAALLAEWGASYCGGFRASTAFSSIFTDCPEIIRYAANLTYYFCSA